LSCFYGDVTITQQIDNFSARGMVVLTAVSKRQQRHLLNVSKHNNINKTKNQFSTALILNKEKENLSKCGCKTS